MQVNLQLYRLCNATTAASSNSTVMAPGVELSSGEAEASEASGVQFLDEGIFRYMKVEQGQEESCVILPLASRCISLEESFLGLDHAFFVLEVRVHSHMWLVCTAPHHLITSLSKRGI